MTYYKVQTKLKSDKSCKIDLFNLTPKLCEGTEVNSVRKRVTALDNAFTAKQCTHAMCIFALKELKCVT